ncbi:hypothetical protein K461DRAFT_131544 [Myriangium duriaei CBS 260.36]|uniref:F-box domain-containing protein n=1 Tax=Myriangium duriaei CBS 260.36 TaxID=1168546 RepID=A0A9P4J1Y0_9PEZI|nr:hypothetical protein K461DRAFT_131544 [Myriangium duriaei CBS 260.36]
MIDNCHGQYRLPSHATQGITQGRRLCHHDNASLPNIVCSSSFSSLFHHSRKEPYHAMAAPLEFLPAEICGRILCSTELEDLPNLVRASPLYFRQYVLDRTSILNHSLHATIPGLVLDLLAVQQTPLPQTTGFVDRGSFDNPKRYTDSEFMDRGDRQARRRGPCPPWRTMILLDHHGRVRPYG